MAVQELTDGVFQQKVAERYPTPRMSGKWRLQTGPKTFDLVQRASGLCETDRPNVLARAMAAPQRQPSWPRDHLALSGDRFRTKRTQQVDPERKSSTFKRDPAKQSLAVRSLSQRNRFKLPVRSNERLEDLNAWSPLPDKHCNQDAYCHTNPKHEP